MMDTEGNFQQQFQTSLVTNNEEAMEMQQSTQQHIEQRGLCQQEEQMQMEDTRDGNAPHFAKYAEQSIDETRTESNLNESQKCPSCKYVFRKETYDTTTQDFSVTSTTQKTRVNTRQIEMMGRIMYPIQATYEDQNRIVVGENEFLNFYLRFGVEQKEMNAISQKMVRHVYVQTKIEKRSNSDILPQCPPPRTRTLARMVPVVEFKREVVTTQTK